MATQFASLREDCGDRQTSQPPPAPHYTLSPLTRTPSHHTLHLISYHLSIPSHSRPGSATGHTAPHTTLTTTRLPAELWPHLYI